MFEKGMGQAAVLLSAALLAGCGGGGGSDDGTGGTTASFFAVEQLGETSGSFRYTVVCVEGTGFVDPNSAQGRRMGNFLARYHNLTGSYTMQSKTQTSCRDQYRTPTVVMSLGDYEQRVVVSITSTPIVPRTCPVTAGSGFGGLQLLGVASLSLLSGLALDIGTALFDPGALAYSNSASGAPATTGALRLSLWAVPGSYSGAALPTGYLIGRDPLRNVSPLRNGQNYDVPVFTLNTTSPPRGSYCLSVQLEEYRADCTTADKYCVIDWYQFGQSWQFE